MQEEIWVISFIGPIVAGMKLDQFLNEKHSSSDLRRKVIVKNSE